MSKVPPFSIVVQHPPLPRKISHFVFGLTAKPYEPTGTSVILKLPSAADVARCVFGDSSHGDVVNIIAGESQISTTAPPTALPAWMTLPATLPRATSPAFGIAGPPPTTAIASTLPVRPAI